MNGMIKWRRLASVGRTDIALVSLKDYTNPLVELHDNVRDKSVLVHKADVDALIEALRRAKAEQP